MATITVAGGSTANSAIADSTGNGRDGSSFPVPATWPSRQKYPQEQKVFARPKTYR